MRCKALRDHFALNKIFIGRESQLADFRERMKGWLQSLSQFSKDRNAPFNSLFVTIDGNRGFGKSALLERFRLLALGTDDSLLVSFIIDWRTVSAAFHRTDDTSPGYQYFSALQRRFRAAFAPEQALKFPRFVETLQLIEHPKDDVKLLDEQKEQQESPFQEPGESSAFMSLPSSRDFGKYQCHVRSLAKSFVQDLCNGQEHRPIVVCIDNFDVRDSFLREVMLAAGNRIGWIIAGRKSIPAHQNFMQSQFALSISLGMKNGGVLTSNDIMAYFDELHRRQPFLPAISQETAVRIYEDTLGVPLAVNAMAKFYTQKPDPQALTGSVGSMRKVVDEYFSYMPLPSEDRQKLCALALVRRPDDSEMFMTALGFAVGQEKEYEEEVARLHSLYGLVFSDERSPVLHEEVRHWLRVWLLRPLQKYLLRPILPPLFADCQARLTELEELLQFGTLRVSGAILRWV
jgi:hypothetical protein